jgi:hypothetical protein
MTWSSRGPGHPAANGLGPDTTRKSFTWYGLPGPAPAADADGALCSSRTLASSGKPAVKAILDLIAHPSLLAAGSPRLVSPAARRTPSLDQAQRFIRLDRRRTTRAGGAVATTPDAAGTYPAAPARLGPAQLRE